MKTAEVLLKLYKDGYLSRTGTLIFSNSIYSDIEEDYYTETTTFVFEDESALTFDGKTREVVCG